MTTARHRRRRRERRRRGRPRDEAHGVAATIGRLLLRLVPGVLAIVALALVVSEATPNGSFGLGLCAVLFTPLVAISVAQVVRVYLGQISHTSLGAPPAKFFMGSDPDVYHRAVPSMAIGLLGMEALLVGLLWSDDLSALGVVGAVLFLGCWPLVLSTYHLRRPSVLVPPELRRGAGQPEA